GSKRPSAQIEQLGELPVVASEGLDRKSTRLNSSHVSISYAVFCLKKKTACRRYRYRNRTNGGTRAIYGSPSLLDQSLPPARICSTCSGTPDVWHLCSTRSFTTVRK